MITGFRARKAATAKRLVYLFWGFLNPVRDPRSTIGGIRHQSDGITVKLQPVEIGRRGNRHSGTQGFL
jgi:hypothetical protein